MLAYLKMFLLFLSTAFVKSHVWRAGGGLTLEKKEVGDPGVSAKQQNIRLHQNLDSESPCSSNSTRFLQVSILCFLCISCAYVLLAPV